MLTESNKKYIAVTIRKENLMKYLQSIFYVLLLNSILFAQAPDTLWTKTFGGNHTDGANSVQLTSDNGYVITGWTRSFGADFPDVWLIKTDANGDTLWTKMYGVSGGGCFFEPAGDVGTSVQQTNDGGYIITGYIWRSGPVPCDFDVWLLKTDASGDTLWSQVFGGSYQDIGNSVQQTTDSGYIITGRTRLFGADDADLWLIKTNANGDTLWTKTFGGSSLDEGFSVEQTTDGGYIITGRTESFGAGDVDVWLIKTDAGGNMLWDKTFGGDARDVGNAVRETADGGYILTGYTESFGAGRGDVWLIKTGPNVTSISTSDGQPVSFSLQQNYPNPFNPTTTIEFSLIKSSAVTIKVFDILGKEVATLVDNEVLAAGSYQQVFDARHLASGIYLYRMEADNYRQTRKLVLLR